MDWFTAETAWGAGAVGVAGLVALGRALLRGRVPRARFRAYLSVRTTDDEQQPADVDPDQRDTKP